MYCGDYFRDDLDLRSVDVFALDLSESGGAPSIRPVANVIQNGHVGNTTHEDHEDHLCGSALMNEYCRHLHAELISHAPAFAAPGVMLVREQHAGKPVRSRFGHVENVHRFRFP